MSAVAHIDQYKTGKFLRNDYRGDISWNGFEHNVLLRNEGSNADGVPKFVDVAMATGADDIKDARGMAVADFDNDGDLDIIVNNNPGDSGDVEKARPTLLRNETGTTRNFLAIDLQGTESNRDAIGAVVTIEAGGQKQVRYVAAGYGFASQNAARIYFGLGEQTKIDALSVRWANGKVERFTESDKGEIAARQFLKITEGQGLKVAVLGEK